MTIKYPEHVKLMEISEKSQSIGEFVEWLSEQGIVLASYGTGDPEAKRDAENTVDKLGSPHRLYDNPTPLTKLLARFFGIDLELIEKEKGAMLEAMRAMNRERERSADGTE